MLGISTVFQKMNLFFVVGSKIWFLQGVLFYYSASQLVLLSLSGLLGLVSF